MKLLVNRNWYLPSWLGWLPEMHIEGVATPEVVAEPGELERTLDPVG